jgi:hypothetical protein
MIGRASRVRFQTWHRSVLPGDPPEAYGILFCVRPIGPASSEAAAPADAVFDTRLVSTPDLSRGLILDVGGGMFLQFRPARDGVDGGVSGVRS